MVVAGLTGGIATGKSTVSAILHDAGADIIDTDKIAHMVVKKGLPAWQEIIDAFGNDVLQSDGEIDRPFLGDLIFKNQDKKQLLNSIVHPYVKKEMDKDLERIRNVRPDSVVILDVPLLLEVGMEKGLSEIIVVYVPESIQLNRLITRDRLSMDYALSMVRSQMPIEEKKAHATIIIDNSFSIATTKKSTLMVYEYLKTKSE